MLSQDAKSELEGKKKRSNEQVLKDTEAKKIVIEKHTQNRLSRREHKMKHEGTFSVVRSHGFC